MSRELADLLKGLQVIYRESFILRSGKTSDYYLDVKKAYGNCRALELMREEIWRLLDKSATCVAASGYGGIPLASAVALKGLNLTLVRNEEKNHGRGGFIDGYVPNEKDKVAIVDDVFTTGGNLRKIIKILEPTGAQILECCVVCKRGEGELGVPLKYVLAIEELMQ